MRKIKIGWFTFLKNIAIRDIRSLEEREKFLSVFFLGKTGYEIERNKWKKEYNDAVYRLDKYSKVLDSLM